MSKSITRRDIIKQSSLAMAIFALPPLPLFAKHNTMEDKDHFDVVVIGGSYAGLSAAMALGRSLRKVLIIDGGKPCNRYTPHSHNFITQDGAVPAAIALVAKEQVLQYGTVRLLEDFASSAVRTDKGFEVQTVSGKKISASKLILATGVIDLFPNIEGFKACWGKSVIHCPYCHGYEVRGLKTGIMANGERAFHLVLLVKNLTRELSVFTNGESIFTPEQKALLHKHTIPVIETPVTCIQHQNGAITQVVLADETIFPLAALYAAIPFQQHSSIPEALGCTLTEQGHIKVDMSQRTTVEGVYACGDNASMMRSVAYAVSTGNITGAMVNSDLAKEAFETIVM